MKKFLTTILSVLLVLTMSFTLVGCVGDKDPVKPDEKVILDVTISAAELKNILGDGALYVTTIGQSDFSTAKSLLTQAGFADADFTADDKLKSADVKAGSTVVMVLGGSGKGLGSAGTNLAAEEKRATEFAANKDIKIIALHIGKWGRRGETSDGIIGTIAPIAKAVLVIDDGLRDGTGTGGNKDGAFDTWCVKGTLFQYSKAIKMVNSIKFLLGK